MPLVAVHYPLGFEVELRTNSKEVLTAAEESWGYFPQKPSFFPALKLRVGVVEDSPWQCPPAPVCRAHGNLLSMIADRDNFVTCDLRQGFGFAWISRGAARRRSYLRYHFLEAAALSLLAASHVTPLHAACVEKNGCGVLLCGDSGAGKSSLAFACARAGWTYISDDASYLIDGRKDRLVVGNPHQLRFRPSAADLFPELEGLAITPRAAGKPSIEFATRSAPYLDTAGECQVDQIVFLNREDYDPPQLLSYPRGMALRWFSQSLINSCGRTDVQAEGIRNLLAIPIYELRYRNLEGAVDRLDALAQEKR